MSTQLTLFEARTDLSSQWSKKYSPQAIEMAFQSELAEKLYDIENISSILRMTLSGENLYKLGAMEASKNLYALQRLGQERDKILGPFQEQVDKLEKEKKVVDLNVFVEMFGIGDIDELRAIIESVKNKKTTPAATFGEEASVV